MMLMQEVATGLTLSPSVFIEILAVAVGYGMLRQQVGGISRRLDKRDDRDERVEREVNRVAVELAELRGTLKKGGHHATD